MTKSQIAAKARIVCIASGHPRHAEDCKSCERIAVALQSIADEARAEGERKAKSDNQVVFEKLVDPEYMSGLMSNEIVVEMAKRLKKAESELAEARKRLGEAISEIRRVAVIVNNLRAGPKKYKAKRLEKLDEIATGIAQFLAQQEAPK